MSHSCACAISILCFKLTDYKSWNFFNQMRNIGVNRPGSTVFASMLNWLKMTLNINYFCCPKCIAIGSGLHYHGDNTSDIMTSPLMLTLICPLLALHTHIVLQRQLVQIYWTIKHIFLQHNGICFPSVDSGRDPKETAQHVSSLAINMSIFRCSIFLTSSITSFLVF